MRETSPPRPKSTPCSPNGLSDGSGLNEGSLAALRNLDQEAAFIAGADPQAARRTVARIREAVAKLRSDPGIGRPGRVHGTRELVVSGTPYIIPYRVRGRSVEVLRVFHGARRWPKKLGE